MELCYRIPCDLIPSISLYAARPQSLELLNDIISFHITLTATLNMCNILNNTTYVNTVIGDTFDDETWLLLGNFVDSSRAWDLFGDFEHTSSIRKRIRLAWAHFTPKKRCKIYSTLIESYMTLFTIENYMIDVTSVT